MLHIQSACNVSNVSELLYWASCVIWAFCIAIHSPAHEHTLLQ